MTSDNPTPPHGVEDHLSLSDEIAEYARQDDRVRDAIAEDDHPIPLWFNAGFYGMIVVGIVYILFYTLSGWSQQGQYEAEVVAFDAAYADIRAQVASANPFHGDEAAITAGAQTFATICAACHKPDGKGLVGPSLVDPYSKYGESDEELYESVANGRPAGMPPWGAQLGEDKIWQVLAFVETLPREDSPGVGAPAPETANDAGTGN